VRHLRIAIVLAAVVALAFGGPVSAASRSSSGNLTDGSKTVRATVDRGYALVQLRGEPLATYVKTKPPQGKKIDFNSATVKAYRAQLSALRNEFKQWLQANAPKARITGAWDISLNAVGVKLNGTTLATLRTAPQVARAEYEGLYYKSIDDPDLALIDAEAAWAAIGGAANAGAGVKVAIVDSGIDQTHPCFDDTGYTAPSGFPKGQQQYTNDKVIVAKVFNNKGNLNGFDARAVDSHGTHVAGTVACNHQTSAVVDGVAIPYAPSGVAPRAFVGNYNVFPGNVENARSEDILNALDAAYADGMDVANMSLGGGSRGIQDLLTIAVDNLDRANMVVAVAAGNEGPGHFTVSSPGSAARALTAGASAVGHFVGAPVSAGGFTAKGLGGDFSTVSSPLSGELEVLTAAPVNAVNGLSTVCSALPAGSLTGKVALIGRGTCDFSAKIRLAELAGAVAVVMVNRLPGDPFAMGAGASPDGVQPTIPAYMVGLADGNSLKPKDGLTATLGSHVYFSTPYSDVQMDFSSQGPTDVDFRVKPDVMAPGGNVLSSVPGDCGAPGCWAFFGGTSMATPHLAGAAAVLRGAHPTWSAAEIRSAIVNTADLGQIKSFSDLSTVTDVQVQGAGQLNLAAANAAVASIGPVSTSFGAVPAISGQTRTANVTIRNLTASSKTWSVSISGTTGTGISFSVGSSSITLAAGASTTVVVTMSAAKGAGFGDHQAWLWVKSGSTPVAHSALYALVK